MPYYKINSNSKYFSENGKKFSNIYWSPRNIDGIIFWGKPENRYIIRESNTILTWKDTSGMLNDATTNINNPYYVDNFINEFPALYFQNDKFLTTPLTINYFTIFTVIKNNNNSDIVYEFGDTNDTGFYLNGGNNSIAVYKNGLSSIKNNGDNWINGDWKILTHQYNGTHTSHRLFINSNYQLLSDYNSNVNDDPGDLSSSKILNLGAKSDGTVGTNSYIAEFIVYNRYLSYEDVILVNNYLSDKYNI